MERVPDLQEAMTAMEGVPVPETFQVFISHRGPDVKRTLASLIYHRLTSYGLSVFLDKDELRTGDTISLAISTAIQAASIHIVIFSPGYAESTWCLEELYWILRSSHKRDTKIIPVFFNVEPTDPRYIKRGCYAKAFENYRSKGRVPIEVIQKWEIALNEASHISGLLFKTKESDYGECLEKIVKKVVEEVFKSAPLEVAKYSVGLHQAAEDFETEIMKQSDSIVVGIAGIVGVGKSTLARYLYELKRSGFTRSCFLSDVRKEDLLSLQKKLLYDLVGDHLNHIDNIYKGKSILRRCLRSLPRIFVVLDDVDHMDQIDGLLDTNDVPSGSLILITSRDKDLLVILLCFITDVVRDCFRVTLEDGNCNYGGPDPAYISFLSNGERRLHIFLWTKDSKLFGDYKEHSDIDVYGHCGEGIECGLIVMVDEGEDVLEVCKEIITAFA